MGDNTDIGWTQKTWNPWQGCQHASPGCHNCYMFRDKARYGQDPETVVRSSPATFNAPLKWAREGSALVFTCSWSDWFHRHADAWRPDAWDIIRRTPGLTYQILTKRHARIADHLPEDWGAGWSNVWLGVSVEDQEWTRRLDSLAEVPAALRFVSLEPLLGPVDIRPWLSWLGWVIVGGESAGRDCDPQWIEDIAEACVAAGVPVFVKQDAGPRPGMRGRLSERAWALKQIPAFAPAQSSLPDGRSHA